MNIQERMGLLEEVAEGVQGTIRGGWMDYMVVEKEDHPLEGVQLRCRWMDDGTMILEHGGEDILRVQIEVTVTPVIEENKPTGFILTRTWATVPALWFVQTPKGDWLEVTDTHLSGERQFVGLRINGEVSHWKRDPDQVVKARRGTLSPRERDDALNALESAFTTAILRDEPPGQS